MQAFMDKVESMSCFTQKRLEEMIWGKAEVSERERGHLFHCDRCRERFLTLTTLHHALLSPSPLLTAASPSRAATQPPEAMVLRPLPEVLGSLSAIPRLAAQGEQPDELYLVSSFANAETGVVGRLLFNRQSRHLTLYLIAEPGKKLQGLKVNLDGERLSGFANLEGCIDFGEQPEPHFSTIEIISPRGVYDLSPTVPPAAGDTPPHVLHLPGHPLVQIELRLEHAPQGSCYLIACKPEAATRPGTTLEVVGVTSKRILTARMEDGLALLQTGTGEEMVKLLIY